VGQSGNSTAPFMLLFAVISLVAVRRLT
jgi:hypothetical protein